MIELLTGTWQAMLVLVVVVMVMRQEPRTGTIYELNTVQFDIVQNDVQGKKTA